MLIRLAMNDKRISFPQSLEYVEKLRDFSKTNKYGDIHSKNILTIIDGAGHFIEGNSSLKEKCFNYSWLDSVMY